MTRCLKGKKLTVFGKCEYVYKASRTLIIQGIRPLNLGRRKRLTWHPFLHIELNKRVSDFWHMRLLFFYKRIKFEKGKKIELPAKKRHNFLMRRIIKIRKHSFVGERSENMLSEFQPIRSRGCRLGTQNARPTRLVFTFEKQRKTKIQQHPSVTRLSPQGRNRRGMNFLYNNRSVTVNMEQVQIFRDGAR